MGSGGDRQRRQDQRWRTVDAIVSWSYYHLIINMFFFLDLACNLDHRWKTSNCSARANRAFSSRKCSQRICFPWIKDVRMCFFEDQYVVRTVM